MSTFIRVHSKVDGGFWLFEGLPYPQSMCHPPPLLQEHLGVHASESFSSAFQVLLAQRFIVSEMPRSMRSHGILILILTWPGAQKELKEQRFAQRFEVFPFLHRGAMLSTPTGLKS